MIQNINVYPKYFLRKQFFSKKNVGSLYKCLNHNNLDPLLMFCIIHYFKSSEVLPKKDYFNIKFVYIDAFPNYFNSS